MCWPSLHINLPYEIHCGQAWVNQACPCESPRLCRLSYLVTKKCHILVKFYPIAFFPARDHYYELYHHQKIISNCSSFSICQISLFIRHVALPENLCLILQLSLNSGIILSAFWGLQFKFFTGRKVMLLDVPVKVKSVFFKRSWPS